MDSKEKSPNKDRWLDLLAGAEVSIGFAKGKGLGAFVVLVVVCLMFFLGPRTIEVLRPIEKDNLISGQ